MSPWSVPLPEAMAWVRLAESLASPFRPAGRKLREGRAADRKFKRPLLRLRRFSVSHSGGIGSGLAPVGGVEIVEIGLRFAVRADEPEEAIPGPRETAVVHIELLDLVLEPEFFQRDRDLPAIRCGRGIEADLEVLRRARRVC